jgi:hypothetical protein
LALIIGYLEEGEKEGFQTVMLWAAVCEGTEETLEPSSVSKIASHPQHRKTKGKKR